VHDPDPDWAGEMLFDVSTAAKRQNLMTLETPWISDCKAKGYNAIEPDNLDSYDRSQGHLTEQNDKDFMALFVAAAHAQGMAVAQKNVPEWGAAAKTTIGFDFEISEECQESAGACQQSQTVYGNNLVFELEYWYETNDSSSGVTIPRHTFAHFTAACTARGAAIRITMRNREVIPAVSQPVVASTAAQAGGFYYNAC
jgi:hypothetical protein